MPPRRPRHLAAVASDPAGFIAGFGDPEALGALIRLPVDSLAPRRPDFGAGSGVGLLRRDQPALATGHCGPAPWSGPCRLGKGVSWRQGQGYATRSDVAAAARLVSGPGAHRRGHRPGQRRLASCHRGVRQPARPAVPHRPCLWWRGDAAPLHPPAGRAQEGLTVRSATPSVPCLPCCIHSLDDTASKDLS